MNRNTKAIVGLVLLVAVLLVAVGYAATTSNTNDEYFKITQNIAKATVAAGDTTTITVTVELIKTPITQDEETTIGVAITAEPQQPNA